MRRWRPRSLVGQMALLLGLALFVAQLANFALILNEREKASLAQNRAPALAAFARAAADYASARPEFRQAVLEDNRRRGVRFSAGSDSGIAEAERDPALETAITDALRDAQAPALGIRAARGGGGEARGRPRAGPDVTVLRVAARQPDGSWLRGRLYIPRRDPWLALRLGAATLLLYLLVLGATLLIALRIARPLGALARAADRFQGRAEPAPVPVSGPSDVRRTIEAFNAMSLRVTALLDQKDHMLGAIGHDLRTPLASLRIRVEGLEPGDERDAAIAKIEEMVVALDDILILARSGRLRDPRPTDLAALAEAIVEDYRELGRPVSFASGGRATAIVQPDLLRRAITNLIDNAVRHAGSAELSVEPGEGQVALIVSDSGPGIPAERRAEVLLPFHRLEASRNRDHGGAGLGLAIAASIAEAHGGRLDLADNRPRGLRAALLLPTGETTVRRTG